MIILFCWVLLLAMTAVRFYSHDGGWANSMLSQEVPFIPAVDATPDVRGLLSGTKKAVFKWPIIVA